MNLKRIRAFILVAEKQSFSEAAEMMKMTQPAVSQHLRTLEEELGVPLIERNAPGVQLTSGGRLVYEAGKEMLATWEHLEGQLQLLHGTLTGILHIGASTIPGTYLLPKWITRFSLEHPNVDIRLDIGDSRQVLKEVKDRQVDLGVVGCIADDDSHLHSETIAGDILVLVAPVQWTVPEELSWEWLKRQPLIIREEGSGTRGVLEKKFAEQQVSWNQMHIRAQMGSTEAILSAVEAGLGLSFVSHLAAEPAEKAGRVRIHALKPQIERCFCICFLKSRETHPLIQAFYQSLQKDLLV